MLGFLGGTGPEGRGIALRLGLAGEVVMIGSRDAARAEEAVRELKSLHNLSEVYGGLNEDVARMSDVAFVTVPFAAQRSLLEPLKEALDGKVVVSTVAPLGFSGGQAHMLPVEEGSAAMQAQALLPGSRVVAALQTVSAHSLLEPATAIEGDVVTCADEEEAKALVMSLVERISALRAVDGGALANSRYVEGITALLININRLYKARSGIKIAGV